MYKYIAGVIIVLAVAFGLVGYGAYFATVKNDASWQKKWDDRDKADLEKTAKAEADERANEAAHAQGVAKVSDDAQKTIDSIRADAAVDAQSSIGLRADLDAITGRLVKSQTRLSACVTDASQAATQAAVVLADVLKSVDKRAGELAGTADDAIERGLACESSYQVISTPTGAK